jgi:hypothetical protein
MRRSLLSERDLVIVLFVMVVVVFSFAQADTNKIERMYFNDGSSLSSSPNRIDRIESNRAFLEPTTKLKADPPVQLR